MPRTKGTSKPKPALKPKKREKAKRKATSPLTNIDTDTEDFLSRLVGQSRKKQRTSGKDSQGPRNVNPAPSQFEHCEMCEKRFELMPGSTERAEDGRLCPPCARGFVIGREPDRKIVQKKIPAKSSTSKSKPKKDARVLPGVVQSIEVDIDTSESLFVQADERDTPEPVSEPVPAPLPIARPRHVTGFLSLPAELRNEIYKLALKRCDRLVLDRFKIPDFVLANKQVAMESLQIFYHINRFSLELRGGNRRIPSKIMTDQQLRRRGLEYGRISDLEVNLLRSAFDRWIGDKKQDTQLSPAVKAQWRILSPISPSDVQFSCVGKSDLKHETTTQMVTKDLIAWLKQWLKEADNSTGLGFVEIKAMIAVFKMKYFDLY